VPAAPRVLGSYYRYQAAASCVFFTPVFYVYYQQRIGLSLALILWIQSYFLAVRALLDLPLGAVADRYSRRACLAAYALCHLAGAAALLVLPALPTVGLAGMAHATGSGGALLLLTRGGLDGLWQPLLNVYMNRLVASHVRATMLSAQSLVARLALAAAIALLGLGTARAGLAPTLGAAALAAAVAGATLVATCRSANV